MHSILSLHLYFQNIALHLATVCYFYLMFQQLRLFCGEIVRFKHVYIVNTFVVILK